MAQAPKSPQLVALRDTHFSLKDGLGTTVTTLGPISDSEEASQKSESFISPKSVSRLLIERGEYSAVPICFQHYFKATVGWSEWVSFELKSQSRKVIADAGLTVPLLISCFCDIFKDEVCLRHVVRRWSSQTHTFVCSWGEFTPTLEDVYNIMRLPIIGDTDPFDITLDEDLEKKLKTLQEGTGCSRGRFEFSVWVRHFWGSTKGGFFDNGAGFHSGCHLEAMFAYWLSKYIFADFSCGNVQQWVLPLAVVLATGARLPLAPLFLGRVYRMLDLILNDEKEGAGCYGITSSVCSIFLQVFIWERFKDLAVEPVTPMYLRKLEGGRKSRSIVEFPLCCRWYRRKAKKDAFQLAILDDISKFISRPYSSIFGFEVFPFYYPEDQSWVRPGSKAMFLATTLHHIPTFGDRFEPVVARYSPYRVRGQFGINQGVPICDFVCRTAKAVIVSFIKHDEGSRKNMFSNCLGTKDSVGIPTLGYKQFWESQLHKFGKFIRTGGTMLRRLDSPNRNKRLIPSKTFMGRMSKLNLSYVKVYSDSVEHVVGCLEKSASENNFGMTTTKAKSTGNDSGSREASLTSKGGKKRDNGKVHHFKSKTSVDHNSYMSARGVKMVLPADALPFEKGRKRKVISSLEADQTSTKRKAMSSDSMVDRERSSSDNSHNECGRGGSSQSDDSYNESERDDFSSFEEELCEGSYEDIQDVSDVSAREVESGDAGVRLEVPVHNEEMETPVRSEGLEIPVRDSEMEIPVRSEGLEIPVRDSEMETPVRDEEMEIPVRGARMVLKLMLLQLLLTAANVQLLMSSCPYDSLIEIIFDFSCVLSFDFQLPWTPMSFIFFSCLAAMDT